MALRRRATERGFTLTELMAVVAIMGILATVGITMFVGHARASKTGEAMAVLQAIRAAQERYRAENQVYAGDSTKWCPTEGVGDVRGPFNLSCDAIWGTLRPSITRSVQFGYKVDAGLGGETLPAVVTELKFGSLVPKDPWYVVQAKADADSDGKFCAIVASSFRPEVTVENEGE